MTVFLTISLLACAGYIWWLTHYYRLRFNELQTGFDQLRMSFVEHITVEDGHSTERVATELRASIKFKESGGHHNG